jgi:hypothetical protein
MSGAKKAVQGRLQEPTWRAPRERAENPIFAAFCWLLLAALCWIGADCPGLAR